VTTSDALLLEICIAPPTWDLHRTPLGSNRGLQEEPYKHTWGRHASSIQCVGGIAVERNVITIKAMAHFCLSWSINPEGLWPFSHASRHLNKALKPRYHGRKLSQVATIQCGMLFKNMPVIVYSNRDWKEQTQACLLLCLWKGQGQNLIWISGLFSLLNHVFVHISSSQNIFFGSDVSQIQATPCD